MITIIETTHITPTKEMPLEVFKSCHRLAFFMELMEKTEDGRVAWDDATTSIYDEQLAEIEYDLLTNDMFSMNMELPKKFVDDLEHAMNTAI